MKTSKLLPKECREEIEKVLEAGEMILILGGTGRPCCTASVINALRWALNEKPKYTEEPPDPSASTGDRLRPGTG